MLRSTLMAPVFSALLLLAAAPASAAPKDSPKCEGKEHPLFTRMPGWSLYSCEEKQFGQYAFPVPETSLKTLQRVVQGHYYQYYYRFAGEGPRPSGRQIAQNYANATSAIGGEVLRTDKSGTVARFTRGGKQTWARAWEGGSGLNLVIVEVESMKQDVTVNADALKGGLATNGHVELAGIFFDTGKSELKAESEAALAEVEKLLKAQPQLALWVVGHTDTVGSLESNLSLSQARAAAVVHALVEKHGVGPKRLAPYGAGPYAPVATNATDEGRARNRRVELVAQ
jgi:outer membrane protein OmpA-like peptidoglycan-associated protein